MTTTDQVIADLGRLPQDVGSNQPLLQQTEDPPAKRRPTGRNVDMPAKTVGILLK